MAKLLSFVLAVTPVMNVMAAKSTAKSAARSSARLAAAPTVSLSAAQADDIIQHLDVAAFLTAAGIQAGTFYSTLQYVFNAAISSYALPSSVNPQTLYNNYQTDYQGLTSVVTTYNDPVGSIIAGQNTQAVSNAMQDLIKLAVAFFRHPSVFQLLPNYSNLTLPLTGANLFQSSPSESADIYYATVFVNELAAWAPIYATEVKGRDSAADLAALALAASQLQLLTTTTPAQPAASLPQDQAALLMNNVIEVATDSNNVACSNPSYATVQAQINCAEAWYNKMLATLNNNIGLISPATNAINSAVSSATSSINGFVSTYNPQIQAASTSAAKLTLYNTALAAINAAYEPLVGTSGTIETQNNIVTTAEAAINAALQTLNTVPSTPLVATQTSYAALPGAFTTAIGAADTAFPANLPVAGLDVTSAQTYITSIPGKAVSMLASTAGVMTPVQTANANVTTLNTEVGNAKHTFGSDQVNGVGAITNAANLASAQAALTAGIAQLNTDYNSTILPTSSYGQALAAAKTSLSALNGLPTDGSVAGLQAAITNVQTALANANLVVPVLQAPDTAFTVANSTSTYANYTPGQAVIAMNTALTNYKAPTHTGLSAGDIGAIIGGVLGGAILAALLGIWYSKNQAAVEEQIETDLANDPNLKAVVSDSVTADEIQAKLEAAASTADYEAIVESNPELQSYVEEFVTSAYGNKVEVSAGNISTLKNLITDYRNAETFAGYEVGLNGTDAQLFYLEAQGFTPDDMLSMIGNAANFPEGFSGSMADRAVLLNKTIKLSGTTKSQLLEENATDSLADVAPIINDWTDSVNTSGVLPKAPGSMNLGGAGQDIPNAATFNEVASKGAGFTKAALEADITAKGTAKAAFQAEIQELENLRAALEENPEENAAELEALDAQLEAGMDTLADTSFEWPV